MKSETKEGGRGEMGRSARISGFFAATLLGGLVLTIPFWIWPLDLEFQSRFWVEGEGWAWADYWLWSGLYKLGTLPAILVVVGSVVVFMAGLRRGWATRWRKVAAYLFLCLLTGPGLLVNAIFKEYWGRPRPRQVEPFGGLYAPENVWEIDLTSPGKSFPCGHCSMGFYFFAVALLLWRRPKLAALAGVFALLAGSFIGLARIAQGGHFLSDVLWSGVFTLTACGAVFFALRLDEDLEFRPRKEPGTDQIPWPAKLGGALLAGAVVLAGALATPYEKEAVYPLAVPHGDRFELSLVLEGGRHVIRAAKEGEAAEIVTRGEGHGLPGSAIKEVWKQEATEEGPYFQLKQRRSGWFTELLQTNEVGVPPGNEGYVKIVVGSGDLELDARALEAAQRWVVRQEGEGEISVLRPGPGREDLLRLEVESAGGVTEAGEGTLRLPQEASSR